LHLIGPKRAQLIVDLRLSSGPFSSLQDLSHIGLSDKQIAEFLKRNIIGEMFEQNRKQVPEPMSPAPREAMAVTGAAVAAAEPAVAAAAVEPAAAAAAAVVVAPAADPTVEAGPVPMSIDSVPVPVPVPVPAPAPVSVA
jgi:hypothetical protein